MSKPHIRLHAYDGRLGYMVQVYSSRQAAYDWRALMLNFRTFDLGLGYRHIANYPKGRPLRMQML